MNRRRATRRPSRTHAPLLALIERLETRAMLAGFNAESWSAPGLAPAPLGTGALLSSGVILTCSSPAPGSSGTASPPAPAAGSGGSQSTGLALPSNSGSETGASSTGSGSSNSGGLALPSNSGSRAGSSQSGTGSTSDPNSPVRSSQYTGGSNAGSQGNGTNSSCTLSGSDLWLLYGAGSGAANSSSRASGGSLSNRLTLLTQYTEGSNAGGQGNGTEGTLSNADLWNLYWSGSGAGSSSSGSDEGSLADDPTISAQYTGGSGIGRITPLVYYPESDGPPVFHSGVWTGDDGGVQFVQTADTGSGQDGGSPPAGRPTWNDVQDDYLFTRWQFEFEADMGLWDPPNEESKSKDDFDSIPTDENGNYAWLNLQAWKQFLTELRKTGKEFAWHMADCVVPDAIEKLGKGTLVASQAGFWWYVKRADAAGDAAEASRRVAAQLISVIRRNAGFADEGIPLIIDSNSMRRGMVDQLRARGFNVRTVAEIFGSDPGDEAIKSLAEKLGGRVLTNNMRDFGRDIAIRIDPRATSTDTWTRILGEALEP